MPMTSSIAGRLSDYIATALRRPLPVAVEEKAGHHLLDTLAAIVSGSRLPAGAAGLSYVRRNPAPRTEALVVGTDLMTSAADAALANAMSAHADETDDSHELSLTHPGCAVVPTALALAERGDRSGSDLLRAVALGYDLCGRITVATWPDRVEMRARAQQHDTHAMGSIWGAAAVAGALGGLDASRVRYLLSYTVQQTSGTRTLLRDRAEHIEKAFAFAGMAAANALRTLAYLEAGWTGVEDVFDGFPSYFDAFGRNSDPGYLVEDLGERYVIAETNLKRFSIGSPAQAGVQGVVDLVRELGLADADVARVTVRMSKSLGAVVEKRDMPNINLHYLLTAALQDGDLSFAASHDEERFRRWLAAPDPRVHVELDETIPPTLQAFVELQAVDGTVHRRHETGPRGTKTNPMSTAEVAAKATGLCEPVLGAEKTKRLVEAALAPAGLGSVRVLRELLAP